MAIVDKRAIDSVIADICIQIIQEPLLYFSEADVQQMLVKTLDEVDALRVLVKTSVQRGQGSKGVYHTKLVHREYGGGEGRRVDVVIFDPADAAKINSTNLMIGRTYLTPLYAFEIGTEKTADAATHLKNDLEKLKGVKATGYIIHFFKDTTLAPTGTASRLRTEHKIQQSFKGAFHSFKDSFTAHIRVLAILVRTGRRQMGMRGKCEIFDQQREAWTKVNVKRPDQIKSAILKQLE